MGRRASGRRGRGRLSGIELLPPEAADIVVWASRELSRRERTQTSSSNPSPKKEQ